MGVCVCVCVLWQGCEGEEWGCRCQWQEAGMYAVTWLLSGIATPDPSSPVS